MPGRCAAPPAPAIITSRPRPSASLANSAIQAGVRCAETTLHSCGTPNCVSTSSARCIVSQSDLLPIITATKGEASVSGGKCSSFESFDIQLNLNPQRSDYNLETLQKLRCV